jgi:hypothetical protein
MCGPTFLRAIFINIRLPAKCAKSDMQPLLLKANNPMCLLPDFRNAVCETLLKQGETWRHLSVLCRYAQSLAIIMLGGGRWTIHDGLVDGESVTTFFKNLPLGLIPRALANSGIPLTELVQSVHFGPNGVYFWKLVEYFDYDALVLAAKMVVQEVRDKRKYESSTSMRKYMKDFCRLLYGSLKDTDHVLFTEAILITIGHLSRYVAGIIHFV